MTGNADTATKLKTARTIGGVSFDGSANINLPGVNTTGNQNTTGNAATATKLATARNINGVKFDGSGDVNINTLVSRGRVTALSGSTQGTAGIQMYEAYGNSYPTSCGNVLHMKGASAAGEGELLIGWSGTSGAHAPVFIRSRRDVTDAAWSAWAQVYTSRDSIPGVNATGNQNTTGNAATATKLQTARTIGGVSFDGTANINLPGVNVAGNQNTSGNAATATKLQTARTINGVSFDGSKNIELTAEDLNLQETVNKADNAVQKTGDTLSGGLTFENDSILAWIRNTDWAKIGFKNDDDGDTDSFMWFETGDNGNEYFKWRSRQSTTTKDLMNLKWDALNILVNAVINGSLGVGSTNALGGSSIVLGDNGTGFKQNGDGILDVYANSQRVFRFQNGVAIAFKNIQAGDGKKFTLISSNNSTKNVGFNLWGTSSRPTVVELGDDSGWHFYSQRNTDDSVIFAVNGQIQPSNWGNFDSRYVRDVRMGANQSGIVWDGDGGTVPAGYVLTGGNFDDAREWPVYAPVQKYINGQWYNVGRA
ncbi:phage tail protein [Escherichia coli]